MREAMPPRTIRSPAKLNSGIAMWEKPLTLEFILWNKTMAGKSVTGTVSRDAALRQQATGAAISRRTTIDPQRIPSSMLSDLTAVLLGDPGAGRFQSDHAPGQPLTGKQRHHHAA